MSEKIRMKALPQIGARIIELAIFFNKNKDFHQKKSEAV
jgi:hypothetical protein